MSKLITLNLIKINGDNEVEHVGWLNSYKELIPREGERIKLDCGDFEVCGVEHDFRIGRDQTISLLVSQVS